MRIEEIEPGTIYQALDLLGQNWGETGFDFTLQPDLSLYERMADAGLLIALGAFEGDALVGYSTAFCSPHHFNPDIVFCHSDALFVLPEHRAGGAGARLIVATETAAKARGAHRICWHTRAGTSLAAVLERRGYRPADIIVTRSL